MAARNTCHLAKNPASGGNPTSANIITAMVPATSGRFCARPAMSAIDSTGPLSVRMASSAAKTPIVITM